MNNTKKSLKASNGITLIALVITIIVLLILAGISISMLSGDNSILQKATDAKTKNDEAQIKERIQLAYHSALAGGQGSYTKESLEEELEKEFGENNYSVDDSDNTNWKMIAQGQEVTIPAGIKVIESYFASEIFELNGDTAKKMHVGDYVNFDVDYDNLFTNNAGNADKPDNIYAGKWRVLYVTSDKLKIVSAGVPARFSVNGSTSDDLITRMSTNLFNYGASGTNSGYFNGYGFKDEMGNSVTTGGAISNLFKSANGGIMEGNPVALTRGDIMTATSGYSGPYADYKFGLFAVPSGEKYAQLWLGDRWGPKYLNYMHNDGTVENCNDSDKAMEILGIRPVVILKSTVKYSLEGTDDNGISTWDIISE